MTSPPSPDLWIANYSPPLEPSMPTYTLTLLETPEPPLPESEPPEDPGCTDEELKEAILHASDMFNIPHDEALEHWGLSPASNTSEESNTERAMGTTATALRSDRSSAKHHGHSKRAASSESLSASDPTTPSQRQGVKRRRKRGGRKKSGCVTSEHSPDDSNHVPNQSTNHPRSSKKKTGGQDSGSFQGGINLQDGGSSQDTLSASNRALRYHRSQSPSSSSGVTVSSRSTHSRAQDICSSDLVRAHSNISSRSQSISSTESLSRSHCSPGSRSISQHIRGRTSKKSPHVQDHPTTGSTTPPGRIPPPYSSSKLRESAKKQPDRRGSQLSGPRTMTQLSHSGSPFSPDSSRPVRRGARPRRAARIRAASPLTVEEARNKQDVGS
ncbi:hypothetical protein C8Q76DRAFT_737421 [Earliella scabrosa]|nr:hypothetical protein C8Q76DRAFT_737421 [Earliella scabrosa]